MATTCLDISTEPGVGERKLGSRHTGGLTQRAYLNAVAYLLNFGVQIAVGLIVTPILVSGLGRSLFGVWQILRQSVSYMSAADGRPTQALKFLIANQQAIDDSAGKRRYVGSAMGVWLVFMPVLVVAGATIVWLSPTITKVPPELHAIVRFTCVLLVINFLLGGFVRIPDAVLRGMNLGYKRMGLQAGLEATSAVLIAGAIYFGLGLIGVAGAEITLSILTGISLWFIVKKYVHWFGIARPAFAEVRSFLGLSSWYFGWTLINNFLLASDVIILGFFASASAVTTYTLTGYAAQAGVNIMSMTLAAGMPGLGGVLGQKRYEQAALLRSEMMALSWLFITATGSTILLWNRSFVFLWVGPEHYANFWSDLLIVLIMTQLVFIRNDAYVIDLTLQMRWKVIMGAVAALLSAALAMALVSPLGIVGLCLGILGGRLVLTVSYPFIVNSCLGRPQQLRLSSVSRPGLATVLLFAISGYLGQQLLADNWIIWLTCAFVSFGVILCVAFVTGLSPSLRLTLIKRLKTVQMFHLNR